MECIDDESKQRIANQRIATANQRIATRCGYVASRWTHDEPAS
jgi:hypothetical protein